jgi:hypothetical protein
MGLRVSSFIQTAAVNRPRLHDSGGLVTEGDNVRVQSVSAICRGGQSKTEEEKQLLLELVRTWTEAAVMSERIIVGVRSLSEARAP